MNEEPDGEKRTDEQFPLQRIVRRKLTEAEFHELRKTQVGGQTQLHEVAPFDLPDERIAARTKPLHCNDR